MSSQSCREHESGRGWLCSALSVFWEQPRLCWAGRVCSCKLQSSTKLPFPRADSPLLRTHFHKAFARWFALIRVCFCWAGFDEDSFNIIINSASVHMIFTQCFWAFALKKTPELKRSARDSSRYCEYQHEASAVGRFWFKTVT